MIPANHDTLQGKWQQLRGRVRAPWARLTDDELDQIERPAAAPVAAHRL